VIFILFVIFVIAVAVFGPSLIKGGNSQSSNLEVGVAPVHAAEAVIGKCASVEAISDGGCGFATIAAYKLVDVNLNYCRWLTCYPDRASKITDRELVVRAIGEYQYILIIYYQTD